MCVCMCLCVCVCVCVCVYSREMDNNKVHIRVVFELTMLSATMYTVNGSYIMHVTGLNSNIKPIVVLHQFYCMVHAEIIILTVHLVICFHMYSIS